MHVPNDALILVSAVLIGAGSSLSFIVRQRLFAEQDVDAAASRIIVGSALSAVFYLAVAFIAWLWLYMVVLFCFVEMCIRDSPS